MTYTREEQKANRDKWVAALRGGEFQQTQACLRDSYGYCCLGVAAELAAREGVIEGVPGHSAWRYDGHPTALTSAVQSWLGIGSSVGLLRETGSLSNLTFTAEEIGSLSSLNDAANYTFEQIADVIESDYVLLEGEGDYR